MRTVEYENLAKSNAPFAEDLRASFTQTLAKGIFILGDNVRQFENEFASYCGTSRCVGVASGLDALWLALKAYNFPPGSEVIVPSNTYIATILAILQLGFTPVLVEPDSTTYSIDPNRIEQAITPHTVAILVVHLYGKCCDMGPIQELARARQLKIIEDCAQSHGAAYKGVLAGNLGDVGAFSYYPTKNLGALGDSGAITTNDVQVAATVAKLRNYGSEIKYYNELVGGNSRLDEVQAGFLRIKLAHLNEINEHKRSLAAIYHEKLSSHVIKPVVHPDCYDVYHIYAIRHPERDRLREYLLAQGIATEIHYPVPPHRQKALAPLMQKKSFPLSEEIHRTILSLPISYFHTPADIAYVADVINTFH